MIDGIIHRSFLLYVLVEIIFKQIKLQLLEKYLIKKDKGKKS